MDEDIEKKIEKISDLIDELEIKDIAYSLTSEVKELRHRAMYIHARIEEGLEWLLLYNILEWKAYSHSALSEARAMIRFLPVFDKMEFVPKVEACAVRQLISVAETKKIHAVNNLRKYFSHPKTFKNEIRKFKDKTEYLKAMNVLVSGLLAVMEALRRQK